MGRENQVRMKEEMTILRATKQIQIKDTSIGTNYQKNVKDFDNNKKFVSHGIDFLRHIFSCNLFAINHSLSPSFYLLKTIDINEDI